MMAETREMVGASFLSICVTVGTASFGAAQGAQSPEIRAPI